MIDQLFDSFIYTTVLKQPLFTVDHKTGNIERLLYRHKIQSFLAFYSYQTQAAKSAVRTSLKEQSVKTIVVSK